MISHSAWFRHISFLFWDDGCRICSHADLGHRISGRAVSLPMLFLRPHYLRHFALLFLTNPGPGDHSVRGRRENGYEPRFQGKDFTNQKVTPRFEPPQLSVPRRVKCVQGHFDNDKGFLILAPPRVFSYFPFWSHPVCSFNRCQSGRC